MNHVTPDYALGFDGSETPSEGVSEDPYSVEALASALVVMDVLRNVPSPTIRAIAERVAELGWTPPHPKFTAFRANLMKNPALLEAYQAVKAKQDARPRVYIDTNDWWMGYYRGPNHHFICLLPTVVIRIKRRSAE